MLELALSDPFVHLLSTQLKWELNVKLEIEFWLSLNGRALAVAACSDVETFPSPHTTLISNPAHEVILKAVVY